jgi:8-oxo-dGTP diphosphatase
MTVLQSSLQVVLVERPEGGVGLPGVLVLPNEDLAQAAARALADKAGLQEVYVEQLAAFGAPRRDPRGRVVSVAHFALVPAPRLAPPAGGLHLVDALPPLAFDHETIVAAAIERLRRDVARGPVGFELLPPRFTLLDLRRVHEAILGRPLNKDSFRRRMLDSGAIGATGELQTGMANRPAQLFQRVHER